MFEQYSPLLSRQQSKFIPKSRFSSYEWGMETSAIRTSDSNVGQSVYETNTVA
jgi:hypothetical protein